MAAVNLIGLDLGTVAIRAAETRTSGEIRFVVEPALELADLRAGVPPRERALHVFSDLHMWNTELRNGVLIYVLMADRDVEIIIRPKAEGYETGVVSVLVA